MPARGKRGELAVDGRMWRVALAFALVFAALQIASWWLLRRGLLNGLLIGTARLSATLDRLVGIEAHARVNEILVANRVLRIDLDCTAMSIMFVYAALIASYPLAWRRRVVGLVAGLLVIQIANLLRLVAVAWLAGHASGEVFLFFHDYLFMVGMVIVAVVTWGVYLAKARDHARAS